MLHLLTLTIFLSVAHASSESNEVSQFIPYDIPLGEGSSSSALRVMIPIEPGERSVTTASAFHASVSLAWDIVVEPNQGGLVDAKVQHLPAAPLSASESWHHRHAAKAGVLDSARFLITFSVVPALQAGGERIHLAAARGDVAAVRAELDAGADAGARTLEGATPALIAAAVGAANVLSALHEAGANIDERGFAGATPLMVAVSMGHVNAVKVLLEAGADVNGSHEFAGTTPLHFAAEMGRAEVIRILCAAGADIKARTRAGGQPLHTAADTNQSSAAFALLNDCGADHTALLSGDTQPLYMAAQRGYTDVVDVLAVAGANLDYIMPKGAFKGALIEHDDSGGDFDKPLNGAFYSEKNTKIGNGATALHAAVENGHPKTVARMLFLGAKQLTSMEGASPLLLAIQYKHPDIALICLNVSDARRSAHVDVQIPHDGAFPLLAAIDYGFEAVADAIINIGSDVTLVDKRGRTALSAALSTRRDALAARLVRVGALGSDDDADDLIFSGRRGGAASAFLAAVSTRNIPALTALVARAGPAAKREDAGGVALLEASRGGWVEGVKEFLDAGAPVNAAIFIAAAASPSNGATRVIELLVEHGGARRMEELSDALFAAASRTNSASTIRILLAAGAPVTSRARTTLETPLHAAAAKGDIVVIKLLLEAGAAVGARCAKGRTPIHQAALNGHVEVLALLMTAGARINSADDSGRTPLAQCVGTRTCVPNSVRAILEAGGDIRQCDGLGNSPLILALRSDRDGSSDKPGLIKLLISRGALDNECTRSEGGVGDISSHALLFVAVDVGGVTAPLRALIDATRTIGGDSAVKKLLSEAPGVLSAAVKNNWLDGVRILLNLVGADADERDAEGRSARDEAVASRNSDLISLFK